MLEIISQKNACRTVLDSVGRKKRKKKKIALLFRASRRSVLHRFHPLAALTLSSEFFPASVCEAEGDGHLRGGGDCRHVGKVCNTLFSARTLLLHLLLLTSPLCGFLLSNEQGRPQILPQKLADFAGLLLSVFNG